MHANCVVGNKSSSNIRLERDMQITKTNLTYLIGNSMYV